jgi:glucose/arabinose dehydrogenase
MHQLISQLESRVLFATVPSGFTDSAYGATISSGTAMDFAPDGRLFVLQQSGQLRVIDSAGQLLATPALSLTVNSTGERGLLGIAFDPDFESNQYIYLYYTATTPAVHNRVSRFTLNGNGVVAGSETVLIDLPNLSATNHNGGAIHFGTDGKLYIAVGENAVGSNSQTLSNTLGKILRINADGSIPEDNLFYSSTMGINRSIWALGLRNPFTFAVQPGTGKLAINDVGQGSWEEVNIGAPGANYGWDATEGDFNQASFPNFTRPRYSYDRNQGQYVAGGDFYNPSVSSPYPLSLVGRYFFQDGGSGRLWHIDPNGSPSSNNASQFATGMSVPVDLKTGPDGFLYYLQRGSGNGGAGVRRISTVPVAVLSSSFVVNGTAPASQVIRFVFDRDVAGSIEAGDLTLTNLDTNTQVTNLAFSYTAATRTLDFYYNSSNGILPDGNYRAILPAGAVDDANDIPTTQSAQVDFFILAGDATRDRLVDTQDFNVFVQNFGQSGKLFTDGDFNYSDTIDSVDFDILISQFGKRLNSPSPMLGSAQPIFTGMSVDIERFLADV